MFKLNQTLDYFLYIRSKLSMKNTGQPMKIFVNIYKRIRPSLEILTTYSVAFSVNFPNREEAITKGSIVGLRLGQIYFFHFYVLRSQKPVCV